RVHLLLCRGSGWCVCFLPGTFLLFLAALCPSVEALPVHDDAHDAFMTRPRHTGIRQVSISSDEVQCKKKLRSSFGKGRELCRFARYRLVYGTRSSARW